MKNRVKRVVNFRYDRYRDMEIRLEKLAAEGLFLEKCGTFFWTFRKDDPKKLHYTVTYFSEGSLFNPDITDNQQTYFEYAKAAGWDFVTQFNQMQIFCSEAENPVPFETDENGKLENIKGCMKKSFLPSMLLLVLVFVFNLFVQFSSFQSNPIDFLSDTNRLLSSVMFFMAVVYVGYSLIDYFLWCKRSARSIDGGGTCVENTGWVHRSADVIFLCLTFGILGWFSLYMASKGNWFTLLLSMAQVPILMVIYWSSIKYLKKKKTAATMNKVISCAVLIIATFTYMAFILLLIIRFDFSTGNESDYRTVTWQITPTESHDYRLYSDDIPLTCEDLYGQTDYDYYSYEKTEDSTIFLTQSSYRQDSLPAKDSPPRLAYEISEPKFDFVYRLAREQLLTIPEWRENDSFKPIDNEIFGTAEAYQKYRGDDPASEYVLLFEDRIIMLDMEEPPTAGQLAVIKEKLQL